MTPECSHPLLQFVESYYCTSKVPVRSDGYGYTDDALDALADDFYHLQFTFECPVCGMEFEAVADEETHGRFHPGRAVRSGHQPQAVH